MSVLLGYITSTLTSRSLQVYLQAHNSARWQDLPSNDWEGRLPAELGDRRSKALRLAMDGGATDIRWGPKERHLIAAPRLRATLSIIELVNFPAPSSKFNQAHAAESNMAGLGVNTLRIEKYLLPSRILNASFCLIKAVSVPIVTIIALFATSLPGHNQSNKELPPSIIYFWVSPTKTFSRSLTCNTQRDRIS
jgi:hypothetical protein